LAALTAPQDCIEEMRLEYIGLRDRMVAGLRSIPGVKVNLPDGAFYTFPDVSAISSRAGIDTAELTSRLLREAHVVGVPGEAFGMAGHIRFSYATSATEIDRGIERLRTFFATL
jgi:aspartate aminotransferase